MTDLDLEFARFAAEIAEVEVQSTAEPENNVPARLPPPPVPPPGAAQNRLRPPNVPPPGAAPSRLPPPPVPPPGAGPAAGPSGAPFEGPGAPHPPSPSGLTGAVMRPATQRPAMQGPPPVMGGPVPHAGPPMGAPGMGPPPFGAPQAFHGAPPSAQVPYGAPGVPGPLPGSPMGVPGFPTTAVLAGMAEHPAVSAVPGVGQSGGAYYSSGPVAPPAPPSAPPGAPPGKPGMTDAEKMAKAIPRQAGGQKWYDPTLAEWPENDFRIFVGDLGNEVNDEQLMKAFSKYSSLAKAKIVRDKRTNKSKGFGFISIMDPLEGAKAMREMQGKYIGNRPCKLRKSTWDERTDEVKLKKMKKKNKKHI